MKEHTGTGSDSVCLANGGKKGEIRVTEGESSISELIATAAETRASNQVLFDAPCHSSARKYASARITNGTLV